MASEVLQGLIQQLRDQPIAPPGATVAQIREGFVAATAGLPVADGVTIEPVASGAIAGEWVIPDTEQAARVIVYLHGGGYLIGSPATHRALVSALAKAAGARALSLDYRLAPEHPFPAAVDDAVAAFRWLLGQGYAPGGIVIAGDSAGGGLAIATLVALRDAGTPLPAAGVCFSPWVDLEATGETMITKADVDPMVQKEALAMMAGGYLQGADPRHPLAAPLYADLTGLPPLLIQVGTAETLLEDAIRITARARAAGVEVTLETWEEMIHVFQLFAPVLPEGQQAVENAAAYIRTCTAAAIPSAG